MKASPRHDVATGDDRAARSDEVGRFTKFGVRLTIIVVFGVAVRIAYIQGVGPHAPYFADSGWYVTQGYNILHGHRYLDIGRQFAYLNGHAAATSLRPSAFWPPGYPTFLAGVQAVFGSGVWERSRVAGAFTGGATIALTGLLGRSIAGRAVGLLGALLIALSPLIIAVDGSLMSETLYVPLVLLALLLADHARTHPTIGSWCALGVATGAAALTRQDALLLIPCAVLPAAKLSRDPIRHLLPRVALGLAVTGLVIVPWIVRNATAIGDPTITTGSTATALAGANCATTYRGPAIGYWDGACAQFQLGYQLNEVTYAHKIRTQATRYALAHTSRWPTVLAARVGRVWGLWNPVDQARREHVESRNLLWQELMWPISLATLVLGLIGIRVLARQRRLIAMLIAPIAMTTLIALLSYGNTRFRAPAECTLAIGAAAALLNLRRRYASTRLSSPVPRHADSRWS